MITAPLLLPVSPRSVLDRHCVKPLDTAERGGASTRLVGGPGRRGAHMAMSCDRRGNSPPGLRTSPLATACVDAPRDNRATFLRLHVLTSCVHTSRRPLLFLIASSASGSLSSLFLLLVPLLLLCLHLFPSAEVHPPSSPPSPLSPLSPSLPLLITSSPPSSHCAHNSSQTLHRRYPTDPTDLTPT